jgi:hypothetical protein
MRSECVVGCGKSEGLIRISSAQNKAEFQLAKVDRPSLTKTIDILNSLIQSKHEGFSG